MSSFSRREFLASAAVGAAVLQANPQELLKGGKRPKADEKINFAGIGVGSQGGSDVDEVVKAGGNLVALCDVDKNYAAKKFAQYPDAKQFVDFRDMLDKMDKEIDAVVIGTPDHTHAVIAMEAMKRGKHVYCEKPLAHSVHEVRTLMKEAKRSGVVTQLGNQGHSFDTIRQTCEWVWAGAIGKVHTVHASCNAFKEIYSQIRNLEKLNERPTVPEGLDYDLWLGPAEERAYSPLWVPWNWRGWLPFGTGTIGDWFCHVIDPSYWALNLDAPTSIKAEVMDWDPKIHGLTYPPGTKITFDFPAEGDRGPVKLVWHDGNMPVRPLEGFPADQEPPGTGATIYGDKGMVIHGSHGAGGCKLYPDEVRKAFTGTNAPEQKIARVKGHHWDWLEAIRTGRPAGSDFSYGARLTQVALLGAIALKYPGETLEWDNKAEKFTNHKEANQHIRPQYRKGWKL